MCSRQMAIHLRYLWIVSILIGWASTLYAQGLIPEQVNQIIIYCDLPEATPTFFLVFSSKPIASSIGREELQSLVFSKGRRDLLALKVSGKAATKPGRYDYFFGTKYDADCPWNNGECFSWEDWCKYSADIWDHIAIAYVPSTNNENTKVIRVQHVVVRRGGKKLLDTRERRSYANQRPFVIRIPRNNNIAPTTSRYRLLTLGKTMESFKRCYYEVQGDVLERAYCDLGQTDKSKYARRGRAWCSEFASYVYRASGYQTPDPNAGDVHWKNMRAYFEKNGKVYTLREVAGWNDQQKRDTIKPGSMVSILTNHGTTTHTILFTTWIEDAQQGITAYTGISGCNKGMVWSHAPLSLPSIHWAEGKTAEEIAEFDQKCFFGVLPNVPESNALSQ